ncbi:DUF2490 domain-containing protein [Sphingomonas tabacisoli]|uniref:DUF2490 domain-containing protein n=1 Tax=Sphingomonas tabacisoli TaxID=2249466 RepID=A0ABW4I3U2_9SPHN
MAAAAVLAPPAAARDDAQLWTGTVVNVRLSDQWRFQEELVARFSDNRNGLYEIESNSLLGYALSKKVTLWAGYTHDPQYAAGHFTVMERRAREQVTFDNIAKIGRATISGRLRLEQRWREGQDGTGWRFRPFVRVNLPLREGHRTALVFSHESFVDLNSTGFQRVEGEERMRNLLAISTPIAKRVSAEIGYMNQYSFVPHGPDNVDHAASFMLNFSF